MSDLKKFLIAIQARSTSTRLPNKHVELIGGMRIIDHVIDACVRSAEYLNRHSVKYGYETQVVLLTPVGDPLGDPYKDTIDVIQGPEHDVLKRYKMAADKHNPDYIVRITGDCPLIPPFVISKHIVIAHKNGYDYLSNVDERYRTAQDGIDCEVLSRRMLDWLDEKARLPEDREHVTTMARREKPAWARCGFVCGYFDFSGIKYSIDTEEDLKRVRKEYDSIKRRFKEAQRVFGKDSIHRF